MFKQALLAPVLALSLFSSTALAQEENTDVLAIVNGEEITRSDINAQLETLPDVVVSGRQAEIKKALLERLIEERLVMQQADNIDLEDDAEFQAQRTAMLRDLTYRYVLSKELDKRLTPELLKEAYEQRKADYAYPAVHAAHILVKDKELAENLAKQAKDGADFAELAKQNSSGPSAAGGGNLGWFSEGAMVPAFDKAVFAMDAGDISDPIKTEFGWHVIKLIEKDDAKVPDYSEVESELRNELGRTVLADYMESLRQDATIKHIEN